MEAVGVSWTNIWSKELQPFCRDMLRICHADDDFACLADLDHLELPRTSECVLEAPGQDSCRAGRSRHDGEGLGTPSPDKARVS
jgi:hypothetical protein